MTDWSALRRIITTNDSAGRSAVLIDGEPAAVLAAGDSGLAEIWQAVHTVDGLSDATDILHGAPVQLEPAAGATKVRWFTVPPENHQATAEEKENAAAFGFAAVQASHARVDTTRHAMMHKTNTTDAIILIQGAVDLILDDDTVTSMKPGDVVIQRATNHAWVNHGVAPALLVAVLISGDGNE